MMERLQTGTKELWLILSRTRAPRRRLPTFIDILRRTSQDRDQPIGRSELQNFAILTF
jgi:hypothetical protein